MAVTRETYEVTETRQRDVLHCDGPDCNEWCQYNGTGNLADCGLPSGWCAVTQGSADTIMFQHQFCSLACMYGWLKPQCETTHCEHESCVVTANLHTCVGCGSVYCASHCEYQTWYGPELAYVCHDCLSQDADQPQR